MSARRPGHRRGHAQHRSAGPELPGACGILVASLPAVCDDSFDFLRFLAQAETQRQAATVLRSGGHIVAGSHAVR